MVQTMRRDTHLLEKIKGGFCNQVINGYELFFIFALMCVCVGLFFVLPSGVIKNDSAAVLIKLKFACITKS